jgi:vacuolar protein-sorting-associated protein 4
MLALKCECRVKPNLQLKLTFATGEKNAKSKEVVRQKTAEYMDRAEKLKTYLNDDGTAKKPSAMGSNGKASTNA